MTEGLQISHLIYIILNPPPLFHNKNPLHFSGANIPVLKSSFKKAKMEFSLRYSIKFEQKSSKNLLYFQL